MAGEFGNDVERIVVLGSSGAGKSTLARRVAEAVGGEHVELDVLAFEGRLTSVPFEVLHRRLAEALDVPRWVLEGMHREELRRFAHPRCDLVIGLDVSRPRVAVRLVRRLLAHMVTGRRRHGRTISVRDARQELAFIRKTLRKHQVRRQYALELCELAQSLGASTVQVRSRGDIGDLLRRIRR